MQLTTRGKALVTTLTAVALVGGAAVGLLIFTGTGEGLPLISSIPGVGDAEEPPPTCPLTGLEAASAAAAGRTAVGVKVENISGSRPQAGLNDADIVYEQPVEGGITRFLAVYQCREAERIGPIRSARLVDPDLLLQFGDAAFAYSGGVQRVVNEVEASGRLQDVGVVAAPDAYEEDPARPAPHNLYASSRELLQAAGRRRAAPPAIFGFSEEPPAEGSRRARSVHLDFSPEADVLWRYRPRQGVYLRSHGDEPHTLEDGSRVSATNVVVMVVELRDSGIVDAAGNPSPEVIVEGSGRAFVFRDGRMVRGRWIGEDAAIRIVDASGEPIPLSPGRTWVELFPETLEVEFS